MSWRRLAELLDTARHRLRVRRWDPKHAAGRRAEDLVHRYLQRRGFRIVARNYRRRSGRGELDLVGWDGPRLVFVEVKARASEHFRAAEAAVDRGKRETMLLAAAEFLRRSRVPWESARFDVVTVIFDRPEPQIRHMPDVFSRRVH